MLTILADHFLDRPEYSPSNTEYYTLTVANRPGDPMLFLHTFNLVYIFVQKMFPNPLKYYINTLPFTDHEVNG